ncbi:tetratricopeptide repeat protein [Bradyrhizobium sp. USDA 4452]
MKGTIKTVLASVAVIIAATSVVNASDESDCASTWGDQRIASCSRLIEQGGNNLSRAYVNRARVYTFRFDLEHAQRDYDAAIQADPHNAEAYAYRSSLYFFNRTKDIDRALADINEALRIDPKCAPALVQRSILFRIKGDSAIALVDAERAVQLDPNSADAHQQRGLLLYFAKGDLNGALADVNDAIRLDPNRPGLYGTRAVLYQRRGDDRAFSDYDEAIRLDPKIPGAFFGRGAAYFNKGDPDRALADYSEAIRLDPNFDVAFENRGEVYYKKGDYRRAMLDFNETIRLLPNRAPAYGGRGDVYRAMGDLDRALDDYNEAIRLAPKLAPSYAGRGIVYQRKGDLDRARSDLNQALTLDPKQEEAKNALAALSTGPVVSSSEKPSTSPATVPPRGRRVALVIGNSSYRNVAMLPNPSRDAASVGDALRRVGFQSVTIVNDLTRDGMLDALRGFASVAANADWAVVYYAGHGMEAAGMNYLIPVDAALKTDRDLSIEAVSLEQVLNVVERAGGLRLIMLDACRDNPFASQMKRTMTLASRSVSRGLASVEPDAGTLVVYAAKHGETAMDGDSVNSPFATAFMNNLKTPDLDVRLLFDNVRDDVMDATHRQQQPFTYGSLSGRQKYYFVATK